MNFIIKSVTKNHRGTIIEQRQKGLKEEETR